MSIIIPANTLAAGGFNVDNSVRFNDGSSDNFSKSIGTATSRTKYTFSTWFKRSHLGSRQRIFGVINPSSTAAYAYCEFDASDTIVYDDFDGSSTRLTRSTNRLFRDVSAWYHIVIQVDTTQGTAANRVKFYINGVQETSFASTNNAAEDYETTASNSSKTFFIGRAGHTSFYYDGYMAETIFLDGQSLAADQFGEFDEDSGIWKPIDVSGLTFGDNGYYLEYKGSGTSANSSGLGADTSGNDNHFTVNNLTAVDQSTDTCTNNFSTLNPLASITDVPTFSDGNLTIDISNAGRFGAQSTIGVSQGKWYAEFKLVASSDNDMAVGVNSDDDSPRGDLGAGFGTHSTSYRETGNLAVNGTDDISYGNSYTVNDIIGIALDLDNNKLYFSKNGTFQASGDPTSGATGTGAKALTASASTVSGFYFFNPSCHSSSQNGDWSANFGSPPYAISSSNADGSGFGNFEYAPPSGYFALCTKNLAEHG